MFYDAIKKREMNQITNNVLMIRPVAFKYNDQTAKNNYYQKNTLNLSLFDTQNKALNEFDNLVDKLKSIGVNVIVIEDTLLPQTPDSIFPNNWISFHQNGTICMYPMFAENRRLERRTDIADQLINQHNFIIDNTIDYTKYELSNRYLEGTGSMVLDRENKLCYAAVSVRTDKRLVMKFCKDFDYTPILFTANQNFNNKRLPIYHTNVMMCIADSFAIICLDSIDDKIERLKVESLLKETNKHIVNISEEQKSKFAGNMLQVKGLDSHVVMSESAYRSLNKDQIDVINSYCSITYSDLKTIENCGGGSARCMMAEIFLNTKVC